MAEHTKGVNPERENRNEEAGTNERSNVNVPSRSSDRLSSSTLDEKSSTVGRASKGRGLSTKDGLTGSDLDGQVTD